MSYKDRAKDRAQNGGPPLEDMLPCQWCRTHAPISALAMQGAMCFQCYAEYCRNGWPKQIARKAVPRIAQGAA